ncbi:MAG: cobalt transporter CbiM [Candidatus Promineifilaceae bacterium]
MHIPDGILPPLVWGGAYAVTAATTALALRKINQRDDPRAEVPKAALLTAAFFIASSIYVPIPGLTSAHLLLAGTMGIMLGWYAFPSIVIGLILQAVVFGHGGITTIGANALILGVPALAMGGLFSMVRQRQQGNLALVFGFLAGMIGVVMAALIFYGLIIGTIPADINVVAETRATTLLVVAHAPVAIVEGLFTAFLVNYFRKTRPEMINFESRRYSAAMPTD